MPVKNLKELQQRWEHEPLSEAFYPLAQAYFDQGLYDAAADVLQQGLRHHSTHPKALSLLGRIKHYHGDADEARDIFNRALESDPDNIDPLCGLAEVDLDAGNITRARTWLKRAASLGQTSWSRKLQHELGRKQGTVPDAELPFVSETMVDLYLKQGMEEKAIAALQQLIANNPQDSSLRTRLEQLQPQTISKPETAEVNPSDITTHLQAWLRAIEQRKTRRL